MIAFPVFKIGLLFVKQVAKPIANYVKIQAAEHPTLRKYVINFAQGYHRIEIRLKRRQADVQRPEPAILPLDDKRAIELAANFIGETIIFSTAALIVVAEAYRKRLDDNEKRLLAKEHQDKIERQIFELQNQLEELKGRLGAQEENKSLIAKLASAIYSNPNTTK